MGRAGANAVGRRAVRRPARSQFDRPWAPTHSNLSVRTAALRRCSPRWARARSCSAPRWPLAQERQPAAASVRRPGFLGASAHWFDEQAAIRSLSAARARGSRISVTKPALPPRRRSKAPRTPPARCRASPCPRGHRPREMRHRAEWRARLRRRRQRHVQEQGLRIRQERRHDHRRDLPGARSICPAATAARTATPKPSSRARSASSALIGGGACRRRALVFPSRPKGGARDVNLHAKLLEREAAGRPGHRRPDRRRQVRHHVPVAGAADARPARRRRRRSRRRARASQLQTAGWPDEQLRRRVARRRAQDARDACHRRRRGADRRSAHRGDRGGDRRARAPASITR